MAISVFTPEPGFHYIAVRPEHVPAVEQLLTNLASTTDSSLSGMARGVAEEDTDTEVNTLYTDELLADISAGKSKATVIISEVMDILSQRDSKPANLAELAKTTGREISQMQTVWTHLSRYLKARYGHKTWPIRTRSGYRFDPPIGGDEIYYWMAPTISTRWKRIRGL